MPLTLAVDTYITEEDAETYCTAYGLSALDDGETYLRQATVAIDRLYGGRFIGTRTEITQTLQWPRTVTPEGDVYGNARDFSAIPIEVAQATAELAVMLEADALDPYAQPDPLVKSKTETVDVISEQIEYSPGVPYRLEPMHKITTILAPLLNVRGAVRLVRG